MRAITDDLQKMANDEDGNTAMTGHQRRRERQQQHCHSVLRYGRKKSQLFSASSSSSSQVPPPTLPESAFRPEEDQDA